jgi:hypothetical protein
MTVWGVATPITELGEERVRGVRKIEELFGGRGEGEDMLCGLPVASVCSSPIHQGGEKVKIIGVRWVLGEAVLLASKAVATHTPFVA